MPRKLDIIMLKNVVLIAVGVIKKLQVIHQKQWSEMTNSCQIQKQSKDH